MSNYADSSRVDGNTIKGYKYDVYLSMKHNQEKYIRNCMLEQSKYKDRVAEVVLEGIQYGISIQPNAPKIDGKQLKKYWISGEKLAITNMTTKSMVLHKETLTLIS